MLVPSIFANSVFDDFFDFPYVNDKKTERKPVSYTHLTLPTRSDV